MALETSKKTIEVETLIGAQYSQALIRAETLVPGAGREAIEPLLSEASLSVTGADVQTDRVVLDGTAYCQAVYRQGEETTLRALTAQATLSQVIEVSGAAPGMLVRVNAQVEHVESKYENGHMVFLITCGLRAPGASAAPDGADRRNFRRGGYSDGLWRTPLVQARGGYGRGRTRQG